MTDIGDNTTFAVKLNPHAGINTAPVPDNKVQDILNDFSVCRTVFLVAGVIDASPYTTNDLVGVISLIVCPIVIRCCKSPGCGEGLNVL